MGKCHIDLEKATFLVSQTQIFPVWVRYWIAPKTILYDAVIHQIVVSFYPSCVTSYLCDTSLWRRRPSDYAPRKRGAHRDGEPRVATNAVPEKGGTPEEGG